MVAKAGFAVSVFTALVGFGTLAYFVEQAIFNEQTAELHLQGLAISLALPGLFFCALGILQALFWRWRMRVAHERAAEREGKVQ